MLSRPPTAPVFPYTTLFRSQVPRTYREAAFALGATRWEVIRVAVLPAARSGLVASVFLGLGRALGETIDRKSTRLNSSHRCISYAVFCLKKKKTHIERRGGG